jgi:hypothetical protein
MRNLTTIDSILLDNVTGGATRQQQQQRQREIQHASEELQFCGSLGKRAKLRTPGGKWTASRNDLANVCWQNLRENVESK